MKFVVIIAIVVTIGIMLVSLGTSEAFATDFKDKNGYTPKWAKPQTEKQSLDFCPILGYSGPTSIDVKWCNEFANYYNKKISQNQDNRTEFLKQNDADGKKGAQFFLKKYQNDPKYKESFDKNWGKKYKSIYQAVGLAEPSKTTQNIKPKPVNQDIDPSMFLIYENNLKGYKIDETATRNYNDVKSDIQENGRWSDEDEKKWKGMIVQKIIRLEKSEGDFVVVSVIHFKNEMEALEFVNNFEPEISDFVVFSLSSGGKCKDLSYSIDCVVGKYVFLAVSTSKVFTYDKIMDIMLQKYNKQNGLKTKDSVSNLLKTGKTVAAIPPEPASQTESFSMFASVDVISCIPTYDYVQWKGSIKNNGFYDGSIDVYLVLTGTDKNGKIVTFTQETVRDLYPGNTQYIDRLLDDVSGFDSCGYEIEDVIESR